MNSDIRSTPKLGKEQSVAKEIEITEEDRP
jgi:hypothetical protein